MKRRPLFPHGFSPTRITLAVVMVLLLENILRKPVLASNKQCGKVGDVKEGFTLTVKNDTTKKYLSNSKSLDDCIKLACKVKGANYVIFEDGKCHALSCKKNACKIAEDAKSKQKIVGLSRRVKKSKKQQRIPSKHDHKTEGSFGKTLPTASRQEDSGSKTISNWTLAFSTVVIPSNKTNPITASNINVASNLHQIDFSSPKDDKRNYTSSKRTKNLHEKSRRGKSKKRTSKVRAKLRRKAAKKRSKTTFKAKNAKHSITSKFVNSNKTKNVTERFTRDYPYSYSQYGYVPADASYTTQETDWRRNMIPSTDDLYSEYGADDSQSLRSQLEIPSQQDQNPGGPLFSMPFTNLVRRTEIPRGSHHVSSISIVNDMIPDDRTQRFLTNNIARDSIPTDIGSNGVLPYADDLTGGGGTLLDSSRYKLQSPVSSIGDVMMQQQAVGPVAAASDLGQRVLQIPVNQQDVALGNAYTNGNLPASQQQLALYPADQLLMASQGNAATKYAVNASAMPLDPANLQRQGYKNMNVELRPTNNSTPGDNTPSMPKLTILGIANQTNAVPLNSDAMLRHAADLPPASVIDSKSVDPDRLAIAQERYNANLKKIANLTTFANVLPAKESASVADAPGVHDSNSSNAADDTSIGTAKSTPPALSRDSPSIPSLSLSSIVKDSLLPAIDREIALSTLKKVEASIYAPPSLESSPGSKSLQMQLADATSSYPSEVTSTAAAKLSQNDVNAPFQNTIIPSNNNDGLAGGAPGGPSTEAVDDSLQSPKTLNGLSVDVPFPARLILPAPSQSISPPLSGMSTVFAGLPGANYGVSSAPIVFASITTDTMTTASPTSTAKLDRQPSFISTYHLKSMDLHLSDDRQQDATATKIPTYAIEDLSLQPTSSSVSTDTVNASLDANDSNGSSQQRQLSDDTSNTPTKTSSPTEDVDQPVTYKPTDDITTPKITTRQSSNGPTSGPTGDALVTHPISSNSQKHANKNAHNQMALTAIEAQTNTSSTPYSSMPHKGGHISPDSKIPPTDSNMKHISPISKPKLRVKNNGSIIVLNNVKSNKTQNGFGISNASVQFKSQTKEKVKLRTEEIAELKTDKGCLVPLGMSTGGIKNDQLSASSQLSSRYSPSRARLGIQNDDQGNAGAWCSNPKLNEKFQFFQVDFRRLQEVCRVTLQGEYNARNWVTHYKISFSNDGMHWSIYREGGKEKVLQGNIEQDDWTSYRLLHPIRTRYIRILPQAWEGSSICMRMELYGKTNQGGVGLHGRSNIPSMQQGMIDHLTFEKLDDTVVLDSSPMGNNAFLNRGAAVYDSHGKCRHAARIVEGSDVLLDGRNMRVKPREAISISVWIKVERTEGVHSIFDTVGGNSNHALGQYHFEIVGGAVRWFHRNENGTQIFSAITEPNFINPKEWIHLVATYDSQTGDAKIYVNGSRAVTAKGSGLLSQDWGGRVGIGRHKDTRDLLGDVDEFRIYNEAIQGEKIMELSRECDFDKYYCGSVLNAERGMLISPNYPALSKGPVDCSWEIEGLPGEIIALEVKEFDIRNCNKSRLEVRDRANDSLIGSYCGDIRPGQIQSHGSQVLVKFTSDGSVEGERFRLEFQRERKRASKKSMTSICKNSDLYQNVTLVGGSKAGTYTDLGRTDDMKACQERCCDRETCEIAFMIDSNCYGVHCFDQNRCKIRKAKSSSLNPMLSFITRLGKASRVFPMFADKTISHRKASVHPQAVVTKKQCKQSAIHHNVTLTKGMKSGNFTSHGTIKDFNKCFDLCCQSDNCDAAFLVKQTCFSVKCYDVQSCAFKPSKPSSFNPTLAFVIKPKTGLQAVDLGATTKSAVTDSGACAKSRLSKVYGNVTLRDGISSGEFTDRGSIGNMDDCSKLCCSDENCNLAFLIKETCFTVKCKSYDSCSLKSAISRFYNPKITYVNWSPPRDNLGEGDTRYDYKGCWKDFDMSAFAIPLLEGTDSLLTGPYKKREDPVNDCATVSQRHGYTVFAIQNGGACFSGPSSDTTYKRYGPSDSCKAGRGGAFANSVYKLFDDGSIMSLGCWADLQDRAFRRLEKVDPSLKDSYSNRANPVNVCANVAKKHDSSVFALQKGGQCFIGKGVKPNYERYGPSRKCRYGLGGQMANDVYFLKDDSSTTSIGHVSSQDSHAVPIQEIVVKPVLKNLTANSEPNMASEAVLTTAAAPTTPTVTPVTTQATTPPTTPETTTSTTPATTTPTTAATTITTTPATTQTSTTATTKAPGTTADAMTTASSAVSKSEGSKESSSSVTDNTLKPGEIIYKEELTDTEHIKFIYSAGDVVPNVTLALGIGAGTFTDKGTIENIDECVKSCGETNNCDLAFKLGKQCFGVACNSKDSCNTKPAFSTFYNPIVAFVKHRTIRTQRKNEEAQMDSKPTSRSLCKAKNKVQNVTLVDGIGAGNFTDLGHVSDIDDCTSRCCTNSACELAFMIEDDCYGVTCYSENSCRTRAARNAITLRPVIAFVRDIGSRKVFDQKAVTKSTSKTSGRMQTTKASSCTSDIWDGEIRENVTLVGGVNAGDFTDHGQTNTFHECMSYCCDSKDCDLAFMIDNDCYSVKCKDPDQCKTRTARPTKYKPMIGFKKSTETAINKASSPGDHLEQFFKTTAPIKTNSGLRNSGKVSSEIRNSKEKGRKFDDGLVTELIPVLTIANPMFRDRTPVNEDPTKSIDKNKFKARASYTTLTTVSPNTITNRTTTPKRTLTVIPRPPTGTTPGLSSTMVKSTYSATPTFGDPLTKHSCAAGPIAYNATLKMGMHSGLFTKLGIVSKMDDCIERCCKSSNADVAFMLGSVCFAVKCYSAELCKTGPAMISNIGDLNMNPTLSFLKKKEATMTSGTDIDVIFDEISDKNDEQTEHNRLTTNDHNDMFAKLANLSTVWEVHDRIRPAPYSPGMLSQDSCTDSPITYNVTLKGGIHAGNFTNEGEGLSPRECIGKCCNRKSCDLSFMFADLCYSVKCKSDDDCQSVVAKPSSLNPKVAYVTRNKYLVDRGTMFDVTNDEEQVCEDASLEHSPVMSNRTLVGGLNAGNFTYLGKTRTMRECLGKCCGAKKCDVAYRIDRDCFSVKCFSSNLCKVSDAPAKNGYVQFATLTKKEAKKLIKTQSIAVYVLLGVLVFTVGISGIGWVMCVILKRFSIPSPKEKAKTSTTANRRKSNARQVTENSAVESMNLESLPGEKNPEG